MKLLLAFIRQAFYNLGVYKVSFWMNFFYVFIMIYCTGYLWTRLYAGNTVMNEISLIQMKSYGFIGVAIQACFGGAANPQRYIAEQVRKGTIEMDVAKPLDFQFHMFLRSFGMMLIRFVLFSVPAALIAILFFGMQVPTFNNLVLFLISFMMGILISFGFNFILGVLCIITLDIQNINWAYSALTHFFSGQMVPLWLFPGVLFTVSRVLPFQCIYAIPMSVFVGKYSYIELRGALLLQLIWVILSLFSGRFIWIKVKNRIIVQGG